MPNTDDYGYEGNDESATIRQMRKQIADQKAQIDTLTQQHSDTARENVFLKAKVDFDNPNAKYFVKGYDGEVDVETVQAAAKEAGLLVKEPEAPVTQGAPPAGQVPVEANPQDQVDAQVFQHVNSALNVPDTAGVNLRAGMEEAVRKGGADGLAQYMRSHGLPVANEQ